MWTKLLAKCNATNHFACKANRFKKKKKKEFRVKSLPCNAGEDRGIQMVIFCPLVKFKLADSPCNGFQRTLLSS